MKYILLINNFIMKINNITCSEFYWLDIRYIIIIQIICMVLLIPTKLIGTHAATCDRVVLVYLGLVGRGKISQIFILGKMKSRTITNRKRSWRTTSRMKPNSRTPSSRKTNCRTTIIRTTSRKTRSFENM